MTLLEISASPSVSTVVRSALGLVTLAAASVLPVSWDVPPCADMSRLGPLLGVASAVLMPCTAARGKTAVRVLGTIANFLTWASVPLSALNGDLIIAYAVARCCPPVGTILPVGWPANPVLPSTVKTELGALRAAAKVGIIGVSQYLDALCAPRLSAFLKSVGANVSALKSSKKPLLWSALVAFVTPTFVLARAAVARGDGVYSAALQIAVRDAFALLLGFGTGSRCRELISLRGADVQLQRIDNRDIVEVTFRHTKTRQTILHTHQPFVTHVSHALIVEMWSLFDVIVGWEDAGFVFAALRGSSADALSRDWFAHLIRKVDPECTPHCLRVGLATELWAAGCKIAEIMTAGRWTSEAAVLYIIGSLDKALVAADALGRGGLSYDRKQLRQRGIHAEIAAPMPAVVARWMRMMSASAA
jgi:integrase